MADIFEIAGRIHSTSQEHVVAPSSEIYDENLNLTQEEVNHAVEILNSQGVIVVADHTAVASPDTTKIYREQGELSYSDWMYYGGAWKKLATYSQTPEIQWQDTGMLTVTYNIS